MAFLKYSFALALLTGLALSFIIEPNCMELVKPLELDGNYSSLQYIDPLLLISGVELKSPHQVQSQGGLYMGVQYDSDHLYSGVVSLLTQFMGKWILAVGAYQGAVKMTGHMIDTHWMEISLPNNDDIFLLKQAFRINNNCTFESIKYSIKDNPLHQPNNSRHIQSYLLPSCSTCLTDYISKQEEKEPSRALFLFSRERNVSTSAVDLFRQQAKCLGFPEPYIFYNTTSELCVEYTKETEAEQN